MVEEREGVKTYAVASRHACAAHPPFLSDEAHADPRPVAAAPHTNRKTDTKLIPDLRK